MQTSLLLSYLSHFLFCVALNQVGFWVFNQKKKRKVGFWEQKPQEREKQENPHKAQCQRRKKNNRELCPNARRGSESLGGGRGAPAIAFAVAETASVPAPNGAFRVSELEEDEGPLQAQAPYTCRCRPPDPRTPYVCRPQH